MSRLSKWLNLPAGFEANRKIVRLLAAKKKLFTALESGAKKGAAVINIDDAFGARLAGTTKVEVELNFGLRQSARLRATKIELGPGGND